MNIKIFKTREEFEKYAHFLIDEIFVRLSMYNNNSKPFEPNIPYVAYARYIEKTIHGEDASELKGFKPSQNQRITDFLQEKLIKKLIKNEKEIVLENNYVAVNCNNFIENLDLLVEALIDATSNDLIKNEIRKIDPNENIWFYVVDVCDSINLEVCLSKRQTIKINQAIQDKLDEYWAENQSQDEKEATKAERLWEMNEGR